jgi:hypothetical protein
VKDLRPSINGGEHLPLLALRYAQAQEGMSSVVLSEAEAYANGAVEGSGGYVRLHAAARRSHKDVSVELPDAARLQTAAPRSFGSRAHARATLRGCDFFRGVFLSNRGYKEDMSEIEAGRETQGAKPAVRLRRPERRQMAMVVQCADDLVPAMHPVRMVAAVVAKMDLSRLHEPIEARAGVAGRNATDPELLVGLWLYTGDRLGAGISASV